MPALKNNRQEAFAQGLAQNKSASESYRLAGYRDNRHNAAEMAKRQHILDRVREIQAPAVRKLEITVERLAEEAGYIAFHDATEAVYIENGKVVVKDTAAIPRSLRAAISGIKQTKDGIEVRFYDKQVSQAFLGKYKGMFKENVNLSVDQTLADLVMASFGKPEDKPKDKG